MKKYKLYDKDYNIRDIINCNDYDDDDDDDDDDLTDKDYYMYGDGVVDDE